jgi:hypothetical protein
VVSSTTTARFSLSSKVGLTLAKAAGLRITLNLDGPFFLFYFLLFLREVFFSKKKKKTLFSLCFFSLSLSFSLFQGTQTLSSFEFNQFHQRKL